MIMFQILDLFFVLLSFLTVKYFQLIELLFESCFLSYFLQKLQSHSLKILFEKLISVVLDEGRTVVIAHQELVAIVESKFTVFVQVKAGFVKII